MSALPALHLKALRDLWQMRGQALAIALVVASGIAMLVMAQSTLLSLENTRTRMYEQFAFSDIWATIKRAPEGVAARVAALPGVASLETRIQMGARLSMPGYDGPISALLQSLPDDGSTPLHNQLFLRAGRMPAPWSRDEILISDGFAGAHRLEPGDRIQAIIQGRAQWFRLAGVAVSPEHLSQVNPQGGMFPDYRSYAIVWMPRRALAAATNMTGAFNQLTVRVMADARHREAQAELISEIDRLLARWGGGNTIGRSEQPSWRFLADELQQLGTLTRLFPAIFLSVAAFLLNVVFTRLIGTQRAQIAILKAFGYSTRDVMLHYGLMSALICLLGALIGMGAGTWLGQRLAALYQTNFRFPYLDFRVDVEVGLIGIAISLLAAVGGTGHAVLRAAREPVAQAMRPVAPERYKPTLPERLGLARWLSQPARMVLRQVERRPWRATFSIVGLALAGAIMMLARFQSGTLLYMTDVPSRLQQHEDIVVSFTEQTSPQALHELRALPGVQHVEGKRAIPVKLHHGTVTLNTSIEGLTPDSSLRRLITRQHHPVALADDGLMISTYMAGRLGVRIGDEIQVDVLNGRRVQRVVPVGGLFHEDLGTLAFMNRHAVDRMTGDGSVVDGALLSVLPDAREALQKRLNELPRVASANARLDNIDAFMKTFDEITGPFTWITLILGVIVNFGVVYNAARITLAERARELASLRVLGFSQSEVARILLGEMALLVVLSIPFSFVAGLALSWLIVQGSQSDLYRIPLHIPLGNYAVATLVTLLSSLVSALIILRQVQRLDMIEALKTHE